MDLRSLATLALIAAFGSVPLPAAAADEPVNGITLSTHGDGGDWAHDSIVPSLQRIQRLGANWVTIHPYAGLDRNGRLRFRDSSGAPPEHVTRPIREAHRLGLKILIKPHLAYWGSPFKWRGEIEFDDESDWRRFWRDYETWIVGLARASREADGFAVGTELDRTLGFEKEWRRIIAAVRAETPAALTYAANWTDFEAVPFWDALDAIGIQGYFPLTTDADTSETAIEAGWDGLIDRLVHFSDRHRRKIVFTELGYNRSFAAPVRPWEHHTDGEDAATIQATCMRIALEAIRAEPKVVGAFLWKWFPEPHAVGRNFQLATPRMIGVIRRAWKAADRSGQRDGP